MAQQLPPSPSGVFEIEVPPGATRPTAHARACCEHTPPTWQVLPGHREGTKWTFAARQVGALTRLQLHTDRT